MVKYSGREIDEYLLSGHALYVDLRYRNQAVGSLELHLGLKLSILLFTKTFYSPPKFKDDFGSFIFKEEEESDVELGIIYYLFMF